METAVVICRDIEGLHWLKPDLLGLNVPFIIASDDLRVHAAVRTVERARQVIFLEKTESFYAVAPSVLSILEVVNEWLSSFGQRDEISKKLLYWSCHCEGGDTTQRIQDALLLVRSYFDLIERFRPAKIVIVRCLSATWEDDLLVACARNAGIQTRLVGNLGWRGWAKRIWVRWRPLAKEVYLSGSIVAAWVRNASRPRPSIDPERSVVVQLCSGAKKHLNQSLPLITALDRVGLQGVALCWGAGESVAVLRRERQRVIELESWVSGRDLLSSWIRTVKTWTRVRKCLDNFLNTGTGRIHEQLVRGVLMESTRAFFLGELAHRFRLDVACQKFFTENPAKAARLWTRVLPQGVTAYRALPEDRRPLLFWQPSWHYQMPWPYDRYDVPVDVIFATSEAHRKVLLNQGVPSEQIAFAGLPWLATVRTFQKQFTKADSRKILRIDAATRFCVLLDPSYVIRGFLAPAEQALLVTEMLDVARDYPELHLIIKPHQGSKPGMLEALISDHSLTNLTEVPKDDLPYHALNAADVLVTKMSTLALEGMVLGVPSIGVLLDGETRFACFENAADYVFKITDLRALIVKLLEDPAFRASWSETMRERAVDYLKRHSSGCYDDPNEAIASFLSQKFSCSN